MSSAAGMYLVTRVHGLRTHLISSDDVRILAKAKTLRDVSDSLLKTSYATAVSKLPTRELDAAALEEIFLGMLVERFFFVPRAAQGNLQDLLNRYCARFEVENIKRIIRAKHGGEIEEEPMLIPLPREYTLVNFGALLKASNVDEVVELLARLRMVPSRRNFNHMERPMRQPFWRQLWIGYISARFGRW